MAALRVRESNRSFPPSWTTYHGLSPEMMYRIVDAVGEVLPGRRLTREQLTEAGGVDLLPAFDPYVIAPRSARPQVIPAGREAEASRQAGWISQTLLVDGGVAGVWTHEQVGAELQVRISRLAELSAAQRGAAEARAARVAKLLDRTAVVTWAE